jgi:hypothetical protein
MDERLEKALCGDEIDHGTDKMNFSLVFNKKQVESEYQKQMAIREITIYRK